LGSFGLAVFGWLLGSLGHDAGHFSASRSPVWNDTGLWAMSLLCNPILWQHQHTYAHHSRTNDFEADPDLHHFTKLLRVHRRFQYCGIYKYQSRRIYVLFAYLFVVVGTCIWIPIGMIQEGTLYAMVDWTDRGRNRAYFGMYAHWIIYAACILAWPFFVHKCIWHAAMAVLLHVGTSGLIFAIFSQINHLNEHSFPNDDTQQLLDDKGTPMSTSAATTSRALVLPLLQSSWAAQQVVTSNNFCPQSRLWHVLSNGLNLQIEHHLFPGLNHCHLPIIQPTVQAICAKHGVPYKSFDHFFDIKMATLQWLSQLATEPTTTGSSS
jgi:fatty acid desaturase